MGGTQRQIEQDQTLLPFSKQTAVLPPSFTLEAGRPPSSKPAGAGSAAKESIGDAKRMSGLPPLPRREESGGADAAEESVGQERIGLRVGTQGVSGLPSPSHSAGSGEFQVLVPSCPRQNETGAVVEESQPGCPVKRQYWDDQIHSRLGAAEEGMANTAEECIGLALSSHPTVYGAALGSAGEHNTAEEDALGSAPSHEGSGEHTFAEEGFGLGSAPADEGSETHTAAEEGIGPALPPCPTARAASLHGASASTGGPLARSPATPPSCFRRRLVMGGVHWPERIVTETRLFQCSQACDKGALYCTGRARWTRERDACPDLLSFKKEYCGTVAGGVTAPDASPCSQDIQLCLPGHVDQYLINPCKGDLRQFRMYRPCNSQG